MIRVHWRSFAVPFFLVKSHGVFWIRRCNHSQTRPYSYNPEIGRSVSNLGQIGRLPLLIRRKVATIEQAPQEIFELFGSLRSMVADFTTPIVRFDSTGSATQGRDIFGSLVSLAMAKKRGIRPKNVDSRNW